MGILNVTPDSFSDGGKYFELNSSVEHALEMIEQGADIIDIGGESSRPGADEISIKEEISRVLPTIEKVLEAKPSTIISVDTTKSEVAEVALKAGAIIVNDISGLSDRNMITIAKKYNAAIVIMHIQGNPRNMQLNPNYNNVVEEVYSFLESKMDYAKSNGVESIIIDPGIGFGKTVEQNYELLRNLAKFQNLETPLLIGVSRKSLIGKALDLEVSKRDNATIILESDAVTKGAKIIRTHNVDNCVQLKKIKQLLV
jgi:dihydropteroate synthase